ncbi:MAG: electron transport complex subunit RsxC [Lactobacillaceae bacterium]|jgi:electron transport complex protein RnfC|nr:electron transport complex subunit RsxC [Lactobacillaceae bacterium]
MYRTTGIYIKNNKISKYKEIVDAGVPEVVYIPLDRHVGAPAKPVVSKGAEVKIGTLVAKADETLSVNVYSSVAGKVVETDDKLITIKTSEDIYEKSIDTSEGIITEIPDSKTLILEKIRKAGIVGMGGAGFPAAVKLDIPETCKIECLVINGLEGEPYFTADNRLMVEKAEEIVIGARIINKLLGIQNAIIAVDEENKDAVKALVGVTKRYIGVNVKAVKNKYPTAAETQLIKKLFNVEIPKTKLTRDFGYIVHNVGTVYSIYNAVMKNKPLYERIVTVSGDAADNPQNFLVRAGTPASYLANKAGSIDNARLLICGGVMMGTEISDVNTPISLLDGGLLMFKKAKKDTEASPCIRCGRCSQNCPVHLQPFEIADRLKIGDTPKLYKLRPSDCINCGICSYLCPAKIPLLDFIKMAKEQIR